MGMDVYGKKPTLEEGKYFRNNVWFWRPLADYCQEVAPEICAACKYWQSNDGDGLDAAGAMALAAVLEAEIDSGRCAAYEKRFTSAQEMAPSIACWLCEGTGTRKPVPERGAGDLKTGLKCNCCDGSGHVRPSETNYPFEVSNVRAFATFLRGCGGFEIC
jgi:hypothetical protein